MFPIGVRNIYTHFLYCIFPVQETVRDILFLSEFQIIDWGPTKRLDAEFDLSANKPTFVELVPELFYTVLQKSHINDNTLTPASMACISQSIILLQYNMSIVHRRVSKYAKK